MGRVTVRIAPVLLPALAVWASACGGGASTHPARAKSSSTVPVGTSALSVGDVAQVGRHSLSKAALAHWTAIEGVLTYEYKPTRPIPKGAVPDPPAYRDCIAYLASTSVKQAIAGKLGAATRAQLRKQCRESYLAIQHHILEILLTDYWFSEEAAEKGMKVSSAEVEHAIDAEFPSQPAFHKFLHATGERPADKRFLTESLLLLQKLQESVSPLRSKPTGERESAEMSARVDQAYEQLDKAMKRKWIPRTNCRPGYVVLECRQYVAPDGG
jgi:hypothetical protein